MKNDTFGDRMKAYESCFDYRLPERTPTILRLDGRSFHTYVKKLHAQKPFDKRLHDAMCDIAQTLCHDIPNARIAYTQSDEISILLYPKSTTSQPWFANRIQKMVSVAASTATSVFAAWLNNFSTNEPPSFDTRVFILPTHEVKNYFWWRQADCIRNSVSMLARAHFPHKQLHQLSGEQMKEQLQNIHGISWDELPNWCKIGSGFTKNGSIKLPKFIDQPEFFDEFLTDPTYEA